MRIYITLLFILATLGALVAQKTKTEYGLASVYSDEYASSKMASGENYNPDNHTAAHKSLPFGSIVKVSNMENGKSIRVKINDRGPFIRGYVIELSSAAADILKIEGSRAKVKLEIEKEGERPTNSELDEYDDYVDEDAKSPFADDEPAEGENFLVEDDAKKDKSKDDKPTTYENETELFTEKKDGDNGVDLKTENPAKDVAMTAKGGDVKKIIKEVKKPSSNSGELETLKDVGYKNYDLYKTSTFIPKASGYGVQVGTYHNLQNVLKLTAKLQENWFSNIMLTRETTGGKLIYKVIIGPFEERESANSYKKSAAKKGVKGFVVAVQPSKSREVYQIKAVRPAKTGYAVQIMNLTDADNVILEIDKLKERWFKNILVNVVLGKDGETYYKIILGPLPDRKRANSYKESLAGKKLSGFVVDLSTIK
ncbi:MAG: rare lipoprotein A [Maribacter sp.]|jgi:rare lipoprotein A